MTSKHTAAMTGGVWRLNAGGLAALMLISVHGYAADVLPARAPLNRSEVILDNPSDPRGMQLRRGRLTGESWPDYFADVLLWPYSPEYYNTFFVKMSLRGKELQFVPNVIFEVQGNWILVVRGSKTEVMEAAKHVRLDGIGNRYSLAPSRTQLVEDREEETFLALVYFQPPRGSAFNETETSTGSDPVRVMSAFTEFDDAGGVAEVLNEDQVIQHYKVIRDILELIEDRILKQSR